MDLPMHVVVVGPGALGLGLIGSVVASAGFEMSFLARHGDGQRPDVVKRYLQSRGQYVVAGNGGNRQSVSGFQISWSDVAVSYRRLLDRLGDLESDIFVCTTLGPAQNVGTKFVSDLIDRRRRKKRRGLVVLCPCENTVAPSLSALAISNRHSKQFLYADSMVDRFCKSPFVGRRGIVEVPVGDEFEWAISFRPANDIAAGDLSRVRTSLEKLDIAILRDVASTQERKKLLCNGVHFCAALLSMQLGYRNLAAFFATEAGHSTAEALTWEFALAWHYLQPTESEERIHALQKSYLSRMLKNDHDVETVLRNWTANKPTDFARDILNKVGTAFDILRVNELDVAKRSQMLKALKVATELNLHMLSGIEE